MPYASVQDLVDYAGEAEIARLSTPDGADLAGVVSLRVAPKLDVASDLMDSYFRRRYLVPVPVSPTIRECCCALARHALWMGSGTGAAENVRVAHKTQINWLEDIGSGKVNLDGAAIAGPPSGARIEERPRVFGNRGPLFL